jgi:hypothetical protein
MMCIAALEHSRRPTFGRCEVWKGLASPKANAATRCPEEDILEVDVPGTNAEAERAAMQDDGCGFDDRGNKEFWCRKAPPVKLKGGDSRGMCVSF